MAPLIGALEIVHEAGIEAIRRKSLALTAYLRSIIEADLAEFGFVLATPLEDHRRGGHLSLVHPEASRICRALIQVGVIPDHRPPDIVRMAPVPLYSQFADCDQAIQRLKTIMAERSYLTFPTDRGMIT
jgi:kynureninase